jgi:STAS-like domain of unknown function (DUF4325)/Histidine kinase-like ATPase domain
MPGIRSRGEKIRNFILGSVEAHPSDMARLVAEKFQISRQTANEHVRRLCAENVLIGTGETSARSYALRVLEEWAKTYALRAGMGEHEIWDIDISNAIGDFAQNVRSIWGTAFTEMFNNVIDHSAATEVTVEIKKTAINIEMVIHDNGVGIFKKIQQALRLPDERYAIIELSKGKFTTDPTKHSGEGIFFTSKMLDSFDIRSDGLSFAHQPNDKNQLSEQGPKSGTTVLMKLDNRSTREPKDVYDEFTEDFIFNKTAVPIKLAQVGSGGLVSRSQAKRILAGIDRFKIVSLDFTGIEWIGQAFADEIFRVYRSAHPNVRIQVEGANRDVDKMIRRVKHGQKEGA